MARRNSGIGKWLSQKWVNTEGKRCGDPSTKNKNSPCKPLSKMKKLSRGEKAALTRKKNKATKKGKQFASYKGSKGYGT